MNAVSHKCTIIRETVEDPTYSFKIIILGESDVGKTTLGQKITQNNFQYEKTPTPGFDLVRVNVKIDNKDIVNLRIFDTCGQERYKSLISKFYSEAALAIIMYSITNRYSFEQVSAWIKNLRNHASPDCKIVLIGGKSDLENERAVKYKEGLKCRLDHDCESFFETSSRTGVNVEELFENVASVLYDKFKKGASKNTIDKDVVEDFNLLKKKPTTKKKCC